eukprot:TRINITY_DN7066_c0_g1_i2.p1 TRINITY_DN7066_c0_g1~~TRINITY_DN7066_c0_g1_i2.p1  ORF type:complete len:245 (-),score=59.19 TRINITY_DN7066_c0_g1_i2:622-1356(-)
MKEERKIERANLEDSILSYKDNNLHKKFDALQVKSMNITKTAPCGICSQEIQKRDQGKGNCYAIVSKEGYYLPCYLKLKTSERNACHLYHQHCIFQYLGDYKGDENKVCVSCQNENEITNENKPTDIVVGIDIGGVIIESENKRERNNKSSNNKNDSKHSKRGNTKEDTDLFGNYENIDPVKDSFETIKQLITKVSSKNTFIVSKACFQKFKKKCLFLNYSLIIKENQCKKEVHNGLKRKNFLK